LLFSDIPEITDFSKGFKKPEIASRLKSDGYSVLIHYGQEHNDIARAGTTNFNRN
jgi:hypothetical protein